MTDELKNKIQDIRQADNEISGRKIELKKRIHDFIVKILQENNGIIEFYDNDMPMIATEYADEVSIVYEVHLLNEKDNVTFAVNCEDCDDYSAKNLDYDEMVQIFESVVNTLYIDSIEYNGEETNIVVINHATHEANYLVINNETLYDKYDMEEEAYIQDVLGLTDEEMNYISWDWVVALENVKTL